VNDKDQGQNEKHMYVNKLPVGLVYLGVGRPERQIEGEGEGNPRLDRMQSQKVSFRAKLERISKFLIH
jgi:hypothetical protein